MFWYRNDQHGSPHSETKTESAFYLLKALCSSGSPTRVLSVFLADWASSLDCVGVYRPSLIDVYQTFIHLLHLCLEEFTVSLVNTFSNS